MSYKKDEESELLTSAEVSFDDFTNVKFKDILVNEFGFSENIIVSKKNAY